MEQHESIPPAPHAQAEDAPGGGTGGGEQQAPRYGPPPGDWNRPVGTFDPRAKSPVLACVLSLVPGLGQIYVGYYQRGFMHALTFGGLIAVMATLAEGEFTPLAPMSGIFLGFFYLYNIIDAGRRAALYNLALQGGAQMRLPEEMEMPGVKGSLFGGVILVGIGFIFLLHTRFGLSIDWIHDWWPVIPMIIGFYLIYKNYENKNPAKDRKGSRE